MQINQIIGLLAQHTAQSRWEFQNLYLESFGPFRGRKALAVLERRVELAAHLNQPLDADDIIAVRARQCAVQEAGYLDEWIAAQPDIAADLGSLEDQEAEYWPEQLARSAAAELISTGRISKEILSKALLLDEASYSKFTDSAARICKIISDLNRAADVKYGLLPPQQ
jgi:hypothetical protein